jgi:methyl-accepting chemotaxis protein
MFSFLGAFYWFVGRPLRKTVDAIQHSVDTGNLSIKAPLSGSGDEMDELAAAFNRRIDQTAAAIADLTQVVNHFAKGDFTVSTQVKPIGDLGRFFHAFNEMHTNIKLAFDRIHLTADHIGNAFFEKTAAVSTNGLNGEFLHLVESLKRASLALDQSFDNVQRVMDAVTVGDFSQRITTQTNGDLHTLKNAINATVDNLQGLFTDLSQSASAMENGDLTQLVPAQHYKGEYERVGHSLNQAIKQISDLKNQ